MVYEIIENAAERLETERLKQKPKIRGSKYRFEEINVGGGFEIPETDVDKVRSAALDNARRYGRRYTVKRLTNGNFLLVRTA